MMKKVVKLIILFLLFINANQLIKAQLNFIVVTSSNQDLPQNQTGYDYLGFQRHQLTKPGNTFRTALWNDVWNTTNPNTKIDLNKDFSIRFYANFGNRGDNLEPNIHGADGIVFIIQNDSRMSTAPEHCIGASGGYLGYLAQSNMYMNGDSKRIEPSFAVEFDTWWNNDFDRTQAPCFNDIGTSIQSSTDHLSFVENGFQPCSTSTDRVAIQVDNNNALDVENGKDYCIFITYSATTKICSVYVEGDFRKSYEMNNWINQNVPETNGKRELYWGFTSSTQNGSNYQFIQLLNMNKGNNSYDFNFNVYQNGTLITQNQVNECNNFYNFCSGGSIVINAVPNNNGTVFSYKWIYRYKGSIIIQNSSSNSITIDGNVGNLAPDQDMEITCMITYNDGTIITKTINLIITSFSFDLENIGTDCQPRFRVKVGNDIIIKPAKSLITLDNIGFTGLNDRDDELRNPIYPDYITWEWKVSQTNHIDDASIVGSDYLKDYSYSNGKKEMTAILTGTYHRYKYFYNDQSKTSDTNNYYNCTFTKEFPVSWDFTVETEVLEDYCSSSNCPAKVKVKVKRNKFGEIEFIDLSDNVKYRLIWKDNSGNEVSGFTINNIGNLDPNSTIFEYPGSGKYFLTVKFQPISNSIDYPEICDINGDVEIKEYNVKFVYDFKCNGNNQKILTIYPSSPSRNYKVTLTNLNNSAIQVFNTNNSNSIEILLNHIVSTAYNIKMELEGEKLCETCTFSQNFSDEIPEVKINEINICAIPPYNFRINSSPYNLTKYTYFWDYSDGTPLATGTLSDINIPNPVILKKPFPNKLLRLKVTDKITGCIYYGTQSIIFNSEPNVVAHDHYAVCIGESIQLRVKALDASDAPLDDTELNNYYFIWSPANSLDNPTLAEPTATPDVTTNYSVTIIDTITGCSKHIENILVEVIKPDEEYVKIFYDNDQLNLINSIDIGQIHKLDLCHFIITASHFHNECSDQSRSPITYFDQNFNKVWNYEYPLNEKATYYSSFIPIFQNKSFYNKINNIDYYIGAGFIYWNVADNHWAGKPIFNKIDKNGNSIKFVESNVETYSYITDKVIQDNQGNIIATIYNPNNTNEISIVKFDSDLIKIWSKKITSQNLKISAQDLICDDYNNYIVTGLIKTLNPSNNNDTILKTYVIKVSNDGSSILNQKIISHFNKDITPVSIRLLKNNEFLLSGKIKPQDSFPSKSYLIKLNQYFLIDNNIKKLITHNNLNQLLEIQSMDILNDYSIGCIFKTNQTESILVKYNQDISLKSTILLSNSTKPISNISNNISIESSRIYNLFKNGALFGMQYNDNIDPNFSTNYSHLLFGNIQNFVLTDSKNGCYHNFDFLIRDTVIENENINFSISTSYDFKNDTLQNISNSLDTYSVCEIKPCYCDSTIIKVDINYSDNSSDPTKCCFNIILKPIAKCDDIKKFLIRDENNTELTQGQFSSTNPTNQIAKTICLVDDFSGYKTITIEYLDVSNNIICSTSKQLKCKCDCEELKTMDSKVEIITKPVSPNPSNTDECCFEISLKNTGNCNFRSKDIKIKYSNNINQSDINMNLGSFPYENFKNSIKAELTLNDINLILKPNQDAIIGILCVMKSKENKDFTIELTSDNCETKSYKFSISCDEEPKNCCDEITNLAITSDPSDDPEYCCFKLTFSYTNNCDAITKIVIMPDNTNFFPPQIIDFKTGTYTYYFCVKKSEIHSINPKVSVKFFNGQNLICSKDIQNIPTCMSNCCNIDIEYNRLNTAECCYGIKIKPGCSVFYKAEIQQYTRPNGINTPFGSPLIINSTVDNNGLKKAIDFENSIFNLCAIPPNFYDIIINIKLFDENNIAICNKSFEINCIPPQGKRAEIFNEEEVKNKINFEENIKDLSCKPNPANDKLTISFYLVNNANASSTIIDINGNIKKIVFENKNHSSGVNTYDINLNDLQSGVYYLRLVNNLEVKVIQFRVVK